VLIHDQICAKSRSTSAVTLSVHPMNRLSAPTSDLAVAASDKVLSDAALAAQDNVRLSALRLLQANPAMSQRQLSQALGISLGKTHYMLHALLDKGLLKVQNFKRSDNKLAYAYLLTPSGISQKAALTRIFLDRKEAEFHALKRTIEQLKREVTGDTPSIESVRK
jgi:EPS-associated MarR family transcriptional regulator